MITCPKVAGHVRFPEIGRQDPSFLRDRSRRQSPRHGLAAREPHEQASRQVGIHGPSDPSDNVIRVVDPFTLTVAVGDGTEHRIDFLAVLSPLFGTLQDPGGFTHVVATVRGVRSAHRRRIPSCDAARLAAGCRPTRNGRVRGSATRKKTPPVEPRRRHQLPQEPRAHLMRSSTRTSLTMWCKLPSRRPRRHTSNVLHDQFFAVPDCTRPVQAPRTALE